MTLIGYWPLNEDSGGVAYDYSSNEDHGSSEGSPQFGINGILGENAVNFGDDDWIESSGVAVEKTRTDQCSIVWWAKVGNTDNQHAFASFGDWHLGTWIRDNLSEIRFHVNDSGDGLRYVTTSIDTVNVGEWHMYAGIYDGGSNLRLMVDGETVVRGSGDTSSDRGPWDQFQIGNYTQSSSYSFVGSMQEVRVYNRSLTPAEVQYLYNVSRRGLYATSKKRS